MMNKGELARSYFLQGYNCSQSVAMSFSDELGIEKDLIAKMTLGFGGGIGRLREVCGAFSGIVFVISMKYGSSLPDHDNKKEVYHIIQDLAQKFTDAQGSIICRDLLMASGLEHRGTEPEKRSEVYYKKRPCAELVFFAANLLQNSGY